MRGVYLEPSLRYSCWLAPSSNARVHVDLYLWCEHAASNPTEQHSTQHFRRPGRWISCSPRRLLRERIELLLGSIKLGQELGHLRAVQLQGHDLILVVKVLELQTHNSAGLR